MSEIVIKYKEETLDTNNFTEREKAIYDSGYLCGYNDRKIRNSSIASMTSLIITAIIGFIYFVIHK